MMVVGLKSYARFRIGAGHGNAITFGLHVLCCIFFSHMDINLLLNKTCFHSDGSVGLVDFFFHFLLHVEMPRAFS